MSSDYKLINKLPEPGNPFYNTPDAGGISGCVTPPNQIPANRLNVLPNCVGLANGAFNETYYLNTPGATISQRFPFTNDPPVIYRVAKSTIDGDLTIDASDDAYPPEGGLICWDYNNGVAHVAYISEVKDKDNIVTQDSTYGLATQYWDETPRNRYDSNGNWGTNKKWLGFIYNPAIPYPPVTTKPPEIFGIAQTSSTNVQVVGNINGSEGNVNTLLLYINWDKDSVSTTDYYEIAQQAGTGEFEINIKKPRKAKKIAVLPVRHENQSIIEGEMVVEPLTASGPCIYIYNKGKIIQSIPYIYHNNKWVEAVPNIYTKNKWEEIYNTIG